MQWKAARLGKSPSMLATFNNIKIKYKILKRKQMKRSAGAVTKVQ